MNAWYALVAIVGLCYVCVWLAIFGAAVLVMRALMWLYDLAHRRYLFWRAERAINDRKTDALIRRGMRAADRFGLLTKDYKP